MKMKYGHFCADTLSILFQLNEKDKIELIATTEPEFGSYPTKLTHIGFYVHLNCNENWKSYALPNKIVPHISPSLFYGIFYLNCHVHDS